MADGAARQVNLFAAPTPGRVDAQEVLDETEADYTPEGVVVQLLLALRECRPNFCPRLALDPAAGSGVWGRAMRAVFGDELLVAAVEKRQSEADNLARAYRWWTIGSALGEGPRVLLRRAGARGFGFSAGNPPFSAFEDDGWADNFRERELLEPGALVAFYGLSQWGQSKEAATTLKRWSPSLQLRVGGRVEHRQAPHEPTGDGPLLGGRAVPHHSLRRLRRLRGLVDDPCVHVLRPDAHRAHAVDDPLATPRILHLGEHGLVGLATEHPMEVAEVREPQATEAQLAPRDPGPLVDPGLQRAPIRRRAPDRRRGQLRELDDALAGPRLAERTAGAHVDQHRPGRPHVELVVRLQDGMGDAQVHEAGHCGRVLVGRLERPVDAGLPAQRLGLLDGDGGRGGLADPGGVEELGGLAGGELEGLAFQPGDGDVLERGRGVEVLIAQDLPLGVAEECAGVEEIRHGGVGEVRDAMLFIHGETSGLVVWRDGECPCGFCGTRGTSCGVVCDRCKGTGKR